MLEGILASADAVVRCGLPAAQAAEQVAARCNYSERNQSSSDLLCCQDGSAADGDSPATFSNARRFISRFARA